MTSFFNKMEALPHWQLGIGAYLNESVAQRRIGRRGAKELLSALGLPDFQVLLYVNFF